MEGRAELYTTRKKARSPHGQSNTCSQELRHAGGLTNLDESDEINACTIIVPVDVKESKTEEWLLLFKTKLTTTLRNRTIWWCCNLLRWLYPRSIERSCLYTKLYALQALATLILAEDTLEANYHKNYPRSCSWLLLLRQPNRPCYG